MKFSTAALVLATLAAESVSAASLRHAHRHLHQKKEAQIAEKRDDWTPPPGYDPHWTPPAGYDPYATTTAAAQQQATSAPVVSAPASSAAAPAPSSVSSAKSTPSSSGDSSEGNVLGAVKNAMSNLESLISGANLKLTNTKGLSYLSDGTVQTGLNSKTGDGTFAWLADDSSAALVNEMVNESGEDITVAVWKTPSGDYDSMFVTSHQPAIAVKIPSGASISVSFSSMSGAWSAIYGDTAMAWNGLIHNTFGEYTVGEDASYFDVSREPAISGNDMTITDDTCTSSSLNGGSCVFECVAPDDEKGGDWCTYNYHLVNPDATTGCSLGQSGGKDSAACKTTNKKIKTTFH